METTGFKLNYKRTFTIGFAFFGILLLWQVYDTWCPLILTDLFTNTFGAPATDVQYLVGVMMAIDNVAALLLLPVFGKLSDKTHSRLGKRMPYILVGTAVCAIAFPFIPVFFHFGIVWGTLAMMAIVVFFAMMYRNPAVALMPDVTPKPMRSKANGIINIMGYIGGAFATVLGMVFNFKLYLEADPATRSIWTAEAPFLIGSVLMVISAFVLFILVKENKIAVEVKDEMARGELVSEAADTISVDDEGPMTKANKIMLFLILGAEFFWFMADNGISTFLSNYIYQNLHETVGTAILTIVGGVGSILGFVFGGVIAQKIGRKWTLLSGLLLSLTSYVVWIVLTYTIGFSGPSLSSIPIWLYAIWFLKGFGMSLVHVNSYPMVVELCSNKKIGAFTGYYYTSSMLAQTITPVLLGLLIRVPNFGWNVLPVYASACLVISSLVFFFVKSVKNQKTSFKKGLEALDQED